MLLVVERGRVLISKKILETSVEFKDLIALILFIAILLIRPQGLLGRAGMEEVGMK